MAAVPMYQFGDRLDTNYGRLMNWQGNWDKEFQRTGQDMRAKMTFDLANAYGDIARSGVISPQEQARIIAANRTARLQRIRLMRQKALAGGARQYGSLAGQTDLAMMNSIYAPGVADEGEFMANLMKENYMSRTMGVQGLQNLWTGMEPKQEEDDGGIGRTIRDIAGFGLGIAGIL